MNLRPLKELSNQQNRIALGSTEDFTFSGENIYPPPLSLVHGSQLPQKKKSPAKQENSLATWFSVAYPRNHSSVIRGLARQEARRIWVTATCAVRLVRLGSQLLRLIQKPVKQKRDIYIGYFFYMVGVSKNRGKTPKMDGENNGNPY